MWELDHKEGCVPKNWCFQSVVLLEKTLEGPLDSKIKSVNPKGDQPWIFIGRMDAEAPILWPPDAKSCLIGKIRGDRGWNGLIASQTHWTWVWANSGVQWRIGKPGVLQSMGSQRVGASEGQQGTKVFFPLHPPPPSVKELIPGLPLLLYPRPQDMDSVDSQHVSTNLMIQVCLSVCKGKLWKLTITSCPLTHTHTCIPT